MGIFSAIIGAITARRAEKRANAREDSQLQRMVADAKKAGINPLSALGAGSYAGGGAMDTLGSLGSVVGSALDSKFPSTAEKEVNDLELRKLRAETQEAEAASLQATQALTGVRRGFQPRVSAPLPTPGRTPMAEIAGPMGPEPMGGEGVSPLYVPYIGTDGRTVYMPTPDSPDFDQALYAIASDRWAAWKGLPGRFARWTVDMNPAKGREEVMRERHKSDRERRQSLSDQWKRVTKKKVSREEMLRRNPRGSGGF